MTAGADAARDIKVPGPQDEAAIQLKHPWLVTIMITFVLFIDGFDSLILGRLAPPVAAEFGLKSQGLGPIFAAQQAGFLLGAFLLPPLADRLGRKQVLLWTTVAFSVLTLASGLARSYEQLLVTRCIGSVFLSGVMPIGLALLAESVPAARRGAMLGVAMTGFGAGATASGVAAAWMLDLWGWRSGFIAAGLIPLFVLPAFAAIVPKSRSFAAPMAGRAPVRALFPIAAILGKGRAATTLLLWTTSILLLGQTAVLQAWMPAFFQDLAGVPIQEFAKIAILGLFSGIVGSLITGWAMDRMNALLVSALALTGNGVGLIALGFVQFDTIAFAVALITWTMFQSASLSALNMLLLRAYPAEVRATGAGWAAGAGRLVSIATPLLGAALLAHHASIELAMLLVALPVLFAAVVVMPLLGALWSGAQTETILGHEAEVHGSRDLDTSS